MRILTHAILLALVLAAPCVGWASAPEGMHGLRVEPPKQIKPVSMISDTGETIRFPSTSKQWSLVFFGYTNCPDVCPTTMFTIAQVNKLLGTEASRLKTVFISIDPQRDTPEALRKFVGFYGKNVIGLSGSPRSMTRINRQFGVTTRKFQGKTALAYKLQHSIFIYLLDQKGRLRYMYTAADQPQQIAADLKELISRP